MVPIDGSMLQRRASKWSILGFVLWKTAAQASAVRCRVDGASQTAVPDRYQCRKICRLRCYRLAQPVVAAAPSTPVCSRQGWETRPQSRYPPPATPAAAATNFASREEPPSDRWGTRLSSAGQGSSHQCRIVSPSREGRTMRRTCCCCHEGRNRWVRALAFW